jgi:hypothetical protein
VRYRLFAFRLFGGRRHIYPPASVHLVAQVERIARELAEIRNSRKENQ